MNIVAERFSRVLVLSAHADDAEFFAGGTLARLAREGAQIVEVIATDNGRGSFELDSADLVAQSREIEAREAAKVIGKHEVHFLGYPDGYLDDTPKNELRRILMEWVRRVQPDLVMGFDPFAPFETHPDHRAMAWASVEAVGFAHMPLFHPEQAKQGAAPHLVPVRYWFAKDAALANAAVDIGSNLATKIEALCAHPSQMRMMVQDIRQSLLATGKKPELLPLLDADAFRPAIELFMRVWSGALGARAGLECAELFRRETAGQLFEEAEK